MRSRTLLGFLMGCLASLTSHADAQTKSLLLDFGPTVVAASNATLSAAHFVGAVTNTEIAWNTIQGDSSTLVFSDGSSAAGVTINVGRSTAGGGFTDFNDDGYTSSALGAQIKGGIYAGSSPMRDGCFGGSGGANALAMGLRISGLAPGQYTVYFSGRNTSTANAVPERFYWSDGPSSNQFTFAGSGIASTDLVNSAPAITNTFVRGDNYDFLVINVSPGNSLYLASVGVNDGANQELRGFLNVVEVVPGTPPGSALNPPLIGSPAVSIQQDRLTMIYRRSSAASNYAFDVALSTNLVNWAAGTNYVQEFLTADDGTNQTHVAQDKAAITAKPASFLRLRVSKQIRNAKVVTFGDSITMGYGVPAASNWVNQLAARFNLNMVNAGVSGNTSSQGLTRIQADVLNQNPDFVIINFGMNDHVMNSLDSPKTSQATFRANLMTMVDRVRAIKATPILVTVNYIIEGDATQYYYNRHPAAYYANVGGAQAWLDSYIQIVREVAASKNVDLVDLRAACDSYVRTDFLRSLLNDANDDDGVHPYLVGSNVYAQLIGDYLAAHY